MSIDSLRQVLLRASVYTPAQTAWALADAGIPVFPCVPGGKTPLTSHGFLDATADHHQVHGWWQRWPQANLAIPTGPASGVDVVDVDVRPTGDGHGVFDRFSGQVGGDRWGMVVSTPSGGAHYYYPADPTHPQSSWACGAVHVDFRGAGGYIVIPPSQVDVPRQGKVSYRLSLARGHSTPVDADRLHRLLDPARTQPVTRGVVTLTGQAAAQRLADWVAARPEGERNQGLYWASCRLAEAGHDRDDALSVLGPAAERAGLPEREIQVTVASAYRSAHPKSLPATSTLYISPIAQPVCEAMIL